MNDLARKDFFFCLGIWLAIEIVCFALLPALRLAQAVNPTDFWFFFSLGLGIGGAGLMACATQMTATLGSQKKISRTATRALALLLSWLGLVGIAFPLMFISAQIFGTFFALLQA